MWILLAFLSAFFAGVMSILAKGGIKKTDSTVATAIRTGIVLIMACIMALIVGSLNIETITSISRRSLIYLCLSGVATGASWLCYFRALSTGDINKVVPIDKSSTVITIVASFFILGEEASSLKWICVLLITIGTFLMIEKKNGGKSVKGRRWLIYALLSAVFASATAILSKIGINDVESNLGTAVRCVVVLIMSWIMVLVTGKGKTLSRAPAKEVFMIILSGVATGASWLCYYKALKMGDVSVVVPIDKLSILFTVIMAYIFFKEKLTLKSLIGLAMITVGTIWMAFLSY